MMNNITFLCVFAFHKEKVFFVGYRLSRFRIYGSNTTIDPTYDPGKVVCFQQYSDVGNKVTRIFPCENSLVAR